MSRKTPAPAVPAYVGPTPARKDRNEDGSRKIGPDPDALRAGKINPEREGKVLAAIRAGNGGTSSVSLAVATNLREVTVRYFGKSAAEAGLLDAYRIGRTFYFVVSAKEAAAKGTAKAAKENRAAVLALAATAATEADGGEEEEAAE